MILFNILCIMIGQIIREVYGQTEHLVRQLIEIPIVVSCLFRSFDEFTQNLIFRMITNGGSIQKKQILSLMDKTIVKKEGSDKFDRSMNNLQKLKIVQRSGFQNPHYTINRQFQQKLNEYLENPFKKQGQPLTQTQSYDKEFFNLLGLLRQNNQILRECKIGRMYGDSRLTKQNFDFIRLPLGYKISILIKGYLIYKRRNKFYKIIRDILCLSMMRSDRRYRMNQKTEEIIKQLEMIRLVKRVQDGYFIINEYLYNFAFAQNIKDNKLLNCSIIIETNFKVYTQIPFCQNKQNYSLIKDILRMLVKIDHEQYNFQELIVGEITSDKMKEIFECKIGVQEYLSFFRNYMSGNLCIQKDLGKWNKIHFLGLEGPSEELMIPNNVKQELKLWQSLYKNKTSSDVMSFEDISREDDEFSYAR